MPPHEDTVPFRVLAYLSSDCSHRCSGARRRSITGHASTAFTRCEEGCQIDGARGQAKHDRRAPKSERGVHRQIPELLDKHPVLAWREAAGDEVALIIRPCTPLDIQEQDQGNRQRPFGLGGYALAAQVTRDALRLGSQTLHASYEQTEANQRASVHHPLPTSVEAGIHGTPVHWAERIGTHDGRPLPSNALPMTRRARRTRQSGVELHRGAVPKGGVARRPQRECVVMRRPNALGPSRSPLLPPLPRHEALADQKGERRRRALKNGRDAHSGHLPPRATEARSPHLEEPPTRVGKSEQHGGDQPRHVPAENEG